MAEKFAAYERDMEVYRSKYASWQKRTEKEKNEFRNCVDQLLKRKRHVNCTDVWSELAHANLFLSEEDTWGKETDKFVLLYFRRRGQRSPGKSNVNE